LSPRQVQKAVLGVYRWGRIPKQAVNSSFVGRTEDQKHGKGALKLFATSDGKCPLNLNKTFEKHRPEEMKKPEAQFYLTVKQKRSADDPVR